MKYTNLKLSVFLLSMLLTAFCAEAQISIADAFKYRADTATAKLSHALELDLRPGYVFQSHSFLKGENYKMKIIDDNLSAHLKYGFTLPDDSQAVKAYTKSVQGIGIGYNTFFETQMLGNPIAVYAFQSAPIATLSPRLSLDYEWNFGLSAGWNPYDEQTNTDNHVIGTSVNAYLNASINFNWRIAKRTRLIAGVSLSHFSNGNTGIPNSGVNTAALNLGVAYSLGKDHTADAPCSNAVALPEFPRHVSCDVTLFGAYRRKAIEMDYANVISPDRYPVFGFNINPMYDFGYRFRAGLSADGQFDSSAGLTAGDVICSVGGSCGTPEIYSPAAKKQLTLGLSARVEYVMPFFSINAGIGHSLYAGSPEQKGLYQILALKVAVARSLYLHVGYTLHDFHQPNNLMLGLGFRINNRTPKLR